MTVFERRILIVEDDPFVGNLLNETLSAHGFTTQLCNSALSAKKIVNSFDPDAAIIDISLGDGPSGIELVHILQISHPEIVPMLLSKHPDAASAGIHHSLIPSGVAYLRKSLVHNTVDLLAAINHALRGHGGSIRQDEKKERRIDRLTRAQMEVLQLMAKGLSNAAIAKERGTSLSAVEARVSEIFKTLRIANSDEVVPRVSAILTFLDERSA